MCQKPLHDFAYDSTYNNRRFNKLPRLIVLIKLIHSSLVISFLLGAEDLLKILTTQYVALPPEMSKTPAVVKLFSLLAKNVIKEAISSTVTNLFLGILDSM